MTGSPRLSIIVPVYDVERYLPECLDSILGQDFSDFELIAVDDCSPDDSAAILRDYAAKDSRIRVLTLEQNVGLGRARNAGLEIARGDYVWFIDSDDLIYRNKLALVMRRAAETRADVILFGWVRFWPDGTEQPAGRNDILARAPKTFSARDWPTVMKVSQVAWNKIILRELLERTQLRFPKGYYEDTPFTNPLLAAAGSISVLPEIVLGYRQRSGAITATPSERHFELFDQWARAMKKLGELGAGERLRAEVFPVMIRHCTYVLMGGSRIPRNRRRDYMRRLQSLSRTHRPSPREERRPLGERVELGIVRAGSLTLLKLFWTLRSWWWRVFRKHKFPKFEGRRARG